MALRLNDAVVRGEIRNVTRNSVHGILELGRAACGITLSEDPIVVVVELTGNLCSELAGREFRFEASPQSAETDSADVCHNIHRQQFGVMGDSSFRIARMPLVPIDEFIEQQKAGLEPPETQLPCLMLEWYGPNGRTVMELINPKLEFDGEYRDLADPEPEPLPDPADSGEISIDALQINPDGSTEIWSMNSESEDDDDPYGLFPKNLEQELQSAFGGDPDEELAHSDDQDELPWLDEETPPTPRAWDEIIPGLDPETKAMYEAWDEVTDGTKDEPLTWLFEAPLQLPTPDQIENEDQAWSALSSLLAAMALRGVAFHMCEHYTATRAYRLLIEELLPEAHVHPNLLRTGFTQNYMSHEFCEACDAEMG